MLNRGLRIIAFTFTPTIKIISPVYGIDPIEMISGTLPRRQRRLVEAWAELHQGALYGPLQDEKLFNQVEIDPEVHTLVWPNEADFDPETLHDWPKYVEEMKQMAKD